MLLCKCLVRKRISEKNGEIKILFTGQNVEWRTINSQTSNVERKTDAFFDSLITRLQSEGDYCFVSTYPLFSPVIGLRTILEKKVLWNVSHEPFNNYWSIRAWLEAKRARKQFSNSLSQTCIWQEIASSKSTVSRLNMKDTLTFFRSLFGEAAKFMVMAEKILKEEKPDLILVQNEYCLWEKSLIVAAKAQKIPVLAIQHGIIHEFHTGYLHWSDEFMLSLPFKNITLPDKIAVYGEYTKNLLIQCCNYPKDSIIVTGEPRYDILSERKYSKDKFISSYNLDSGKDWFTNNSI